MKNVSQFVHSFILPSAQWKLKLLQNWPDIVGTIAHNAHIEAVGDYYIVIGVSDACWLNELHFMLDDITLKVNEYLGKKHITRIKLKQVCRNPSRKALKKFANHSPAINKKITLKPKHQQALQTLHDDKLAKALEIFWYQCVQENK